MTPQLQKLVSCAVRSLHSTRRWALAVRLLRRLRMKLMSFASALLLPSPLPPQGQAEEPVALAPPANLLG